VVLSFGIASLRVKMVSLLASIAFVLIEVRDDGSRVFVSGVGGCGS